MKKNNLLFLILTLLLVLPAIFALFNKGFFVSDDGNWMVIRFSSFYENFREGQIPVRFLTRLNYGYGYPVADFLYPLFMYLGVPIHIVGSNFVNTIKIIFGGSLLFSAFFCFLWLRKIFDNLSSLLGSIAYTLFPYHLWDIYKRGSVGEALTFAITPFVLWSIEKNNTLMIATGYALLILAHNTLSFIFIPILFIYHLLAQKIINKNNFMNALYSITLGLSFSSFFFLPAIYDKQFTVFDSTAVSDFTRYFILLNNINLLGSVFFISVLTSILFIAKRNKKLIYFLAVSVISFILTLPISFIFWKHFPFANLIQFPFRLISLSTLGVAYLIAYQCNFATKKIKVYVAIIYILFIFVSSRDFMFPQQFQNYPDSFYSTNQDSTTVKNEYMPKWVRKIPEAMAKEKVEVLSGNGVVENLHNKGSIIKFDFVANQSSVVRVNTVYFPGWTIKIDGKKSLISYDNEKGVMDINITKGKHSILAKFIETPVRIFSDTVSLVSILVVLLFVVRKKYEIFKK